MARERGPRLDQPLERDPRVRPGERLGEPDLEADDPVGVGEGDRRGPLGDQVALVVELAEERVHLAHRADVEQGEDPALERLDHVAPEARERVRTRRARVDDRRGAALEVTSGQGRAVMLAFPVQHRAQSLATFRLLFNAIHTANGPLPRPTRPR